MERVGRRERQKLRPWAQRQEQQGPSGSTEGAAFSEVVHGWGVPTATDISLAWVT